MFANSIRLLLNRATTYGRLLYRASCLQLGCGLLVAPSSRSLRVYPKDQGYAPTSNSYINEIETGKRRPKIDFMLKVVYYFGVTTDQIVRDDIEFDASSDDPGDDTVNSDD